MNGRLAGQYGDLITAYRALEDQWRRYQALFELTPDGYLITDTSTLIQEANSAAALLLQASRDSVVGKSLTEFITDDDSPTFSLWLERWSTWNELQQMEVHIQPGQGVPFPVSLTVATMNNAEGKVVGLRWLVRDITEQKRAEEERAQLAAMVNAELYEEAQELATAKERQRLARDLHDAVSQTLFSSSIISESLPRLWKRDPEKLWPYLIQLNRLNRGALAEMRNLLMEMRPGKIMEVEFDDLLSQLIQAVMGRTQITVSLTIEGEHPLPADVRIIFYRIAQEALNNTVKHAHATQISVYLGNQANQVEMRLKDNGIGFNPKQSPSKGMGLSIMRESAKLIGATLEITNQIGLGTDVSLLWLDKRERNDDTKPHSSHDR